MKILCRTCIILLFCMTASCIKGLIHVDPFPIKANPAKFECYINGRDFVPDSGGLRLSFDGPAGPVITYVVNFNTGTYQIYISGSTPASTSTSRQEVSLSIQNVTGTGIYEFNTPEHQEADYTLYPTLTLYQDPPPQPMFYRLYTPGTAALRSPGSM